VTVLHWAAPARPLTATAAAGSGSVGAALAHRATGRVGLLVHRAGDWIVVVGESEHLPWADGVTYLGELPGTNRVLVPVHRVPTAPPDVVHAAVRRAAGGVGGTIALLPATASSDGEGVLVVLPGR
jgi:hypothetical protein